MPSFGDRASNLARVGHLDTMDFFCLSYKNQYKLILIISLSNIVTGTHLRVCKEWTELLVEPLRMATELLTTRMSLLYPTGGAKQNSLFNRHSS